MKKWTEDFFNLDYQELFLVRTQDEIIKQSQIIISLLNLKSGDSVSDFCCGVGDILSEIEKNNIKTYGVEFCEDYVLKSQKQFNQKNVFQGDALKFQFNQKFDGVYNWYSSFGYFNHDENIQLLTNIFSQLKNNKFCLIDYYNSYNTLMNFKPVIEYNKQHLDRTIHVERKSSISLDERKLNQTWTFTENNIQKKYDTFSVLYFPDEIKKMMTEVGFKNIDCFEMLENGEIKTASFDSKRIIFRGQK